MTLGRTRRNVMIPLKLGMAAAVLMPDLDPGKAEKAMREAAASAEIAAEIAAKAMTRTGEALAAEAAVETAAEVIAEAAAEVIAEAIAETAVERPAGDNGGGGDDKDEGTNSEFSCELDTKVRK
ncbi:MAG: hypothetical protein ACLRZZ_02470 [Enterocloster sp.]